MGNRDFSIGGIVSLFYRMVGIILNIIKRISEKTAFIIGFSLILFSSLCLFLLTLLFPMSALLVVIIEGVLFGIAILFILSAAEQGLVRL